MPQVSVILTTCGRWELLADAIRSVLNQDYQDFELLVINDSDDQNVRAGRCPGVDDRVVWYHNTRPGTKRVAVSCNVGLDHAQGKYAAYLCDDDHWLPGHLSRLMACVVEGAGWVVDKCKWVTPDGMLLEQEAIGNYRYAEPFEIGHELLAQELVDMIGCNFIVHDCALHEITIDRWPVDAEHHTPVDWRFWCSLLRRGLKLTCVTEPGAVAFLPGAWRAGMDLGKALDAMKIAKFNGGVVMGQKMDKLEGLARNMSGKLRKITKEGRSIRVLAGNTVPIRDIAKIDGQGNVRLPPGFVPEVDDLIVPAFEFLPDESVKVEQPVCNMDALIELKKKGTPKIPTAEQVVEMDYNDVRALAKALGVGGLNRAKLDLVKGIDAARAAGAVVDGGCFDAGTITSADIAPMPGK